MKNGPVVTIRIEERINDYSFYKDLAAEVYVKKYSGFPAEASFESAHSVKPDHSQMDATAHMTMLKPDKTLLTEGAVRLKKSDDTFTGSIPEDWSAVKVVIFYGSDYYLTERFTFD